MAALHDLLVHKAARKAAVHIWKGWERNEREGGVILTCSVYGEEPTR